MRTCEAVADGRYELWALLAELDDVEVEVVDGLAEPHADDQEGGQA